MTALLKHLRGQGLDTATLVADIKAVVVKTVIAGEKAMTAAVHAQDGGLVCVPIV
jgi:hypothetical protein